MRTVLLTILAILPSFSFAEPLSDHEAANITAATDTIIEAMLNSDFKTVIDYMPRKLIDKVGDDEKLIEATAALFRQLESKGLTVSEFTYQMPKEKMETSLNTLVLIPTQMVITSDAVTMKSNSYFIASKAQGHDAWEFIDASGIRNRKRLEFLFPEYPKDQDIPQATHEVIEK
ncbi:hypothetical protein ACODM8_19715 [Vibrio ostreicida]|uniref:DUF4440 domain-containing protein n=1 Tax=Vibrio ostreicida TaxID=526588 RepID=A0ABT8BVV5_9VIBR|nr:hypothetical protein [Vibrio ostreicida]MDN3611306.1 hypothetical protein [Vibrio ostreicida]NPD09248.1 hypothetical protein [Vibrio ostreicida]